jgi:serpin B
VGEVIVKAQETAEPRAGSAPAEPVELKVDHPFLFVVRDNASGLILFMGRVADPTRQVT